MSDPIQGLNFLFTFWILFLIVVFGLLFPLYGILHIFRRPYGGVGEKVFWTFAILMGLPVTTSLYFWLHADKEGSHRTARIGFAAIIVLGVSISIWDYCQKRQILFELESLQAQLVPQESDSPESPLRPIHTQWNQAQAALKGIIEALQNNSTFQIHERLSIYAEAYQVQHSIYQIQAVDRRPSSIHSPIPWLQSYP